MRCGVLSTFEHALHHTRSSNHIYICIFSCSKLFVSFWATHSRRRACPEKNHIEGGVVLRAKLPHHGLLTSVLSWKFTPALLLGSSWATARICAFLTPQALLHREILSSKIVIFGLDSSSCILFLNACRQRSESICM